jgi:citrate synthase
MSQVPVFYSQIWQEEPEDNNAFEAKACFCHGYNVYGDILPKASWAEYTYLLFKGDKPTPQQAQLLEKLAIALANRGPRDHSVRAAMNGGVGGSTAAASLMAALGVGAGQYGGAREVFHAVNLWQFAGQDLERWQLGINQLLANKDVDVWLPMEHGAGFDPHGVTCPTPIQQTLAYLASLMSKESALVWLQQQQSALEHIAQGTLAMTGVAAAACVDLGLNAEQAEMLFLLLRLSGAAVHALEQQQLGWKKFPYVGGMISLEQDAPRFDMPNIEEFGL